MIRRTLQQACSAPVGLYARGARTWHAPQWGRLPRPSGIRARKYASMPGDAPDFSSILDEPARVVKIGGRRHSAGLIILVLIPVTAFALGTWQVFRLEWKNRLIATLEDRILRDPLPLPPRVDPDVLSQFDHRRVEVVGNFRHDLEMLIGPRVHDGTNGFLVITPLERKDGETVLVNRGWIDKKHQRQPSRPDGLPQGEVRVEGLLREPFKKNMFTPDNVPEQGAYYFPDVKQMAEVASCAPVWIEATMEPDLVTAYDREARGIPIGRPAAINLRNNHTQYIFTWYALSLATSYMLWLLLRKPPSGPGRLVKRSTSW